MSGWNEVCYLVDVRREQLPDGTFSERKVTRAAFCNRLSVGAKTWAAARSAGLHPDAAVRLRSCDYGGQTAVSLGGVEYEVERASNTGEFCDLTLKRRLRSG